MIAALLVGVLLSAQLSRYHALPDCCALGFGDIQPKNGKGDRAFITAMCPFAELQIAIHLCVSETLRIAVRLHT